MTGVTKEDIETAYRAILQRDVDSDGLRYFSERGDQGLSAKDLDRELYASIEFRERFGEARQRLAAMGLAAVDLDALVDILMPKLIERLNSERPWKRSLYIPDPHVASLPADAPFMRYSTCSGQDILHPQFSEILASIGRQAETHRKLWEWVFVIFHLRRLNAIRPGRRGLVFGVGQELLPALFASEGVSIMATDAPAAIGHEAGWQGSNEYSGGLASLPSGNLDRASFEKLVEWRECDMNAISEDLRGFDFCWSSCCFEHLGDLRKGMDFVLNSVETLVPGGVAVHTTEFNLSSNDDTSFSGDTVIYRKRDIEELIQELRARGHHVDPLLIAPDSGGADAYVDVPPYAGPHLKLALDRFVCTSIGLVIRRGST